MAVQNGSEIHSVIDYHLYSGYAVKYVGDTCAALPGNNDAKSKVLGKNVGSVLNTRLVDRVNYPIMPGQESEIENSVRRANLRA